jgi:hypothetical protein
MDSSKRRSNAGARKLMDRGAGWGDVRAHRFYSFDSEEELPLQTPPYLADFDSTTAMLRALANYLRGEGFPLLGATPRWAVPLMKLFASLVNRLPQRLQERIYIWSGRYEAITPKQLLSIRAEWVAEWMVSLYPAQQYPAVAVGSANGPSGVSSPRCARTWNAWHESSATVSGGSCSTPPSS